MTTYDNLNTIKITIHDLWGDGERERESQKTPLQSYMWLIQEIAANKQEAEG